MREGHGTFEGKSGYIYKGDWKQSLKTGDGEESNENGRTVIYSNIYSIMVNI